MDINALVKLSSRAWSLNILTLLHAGVPGRQAPLLAATPAGRTAFGASLNHLVELGLLERNPGHGHPLRPEFRMTEAGVEAAELASRVMKLVREDEEAALLRKSWTLPILAVTGKPKRFSEIKAELGTITDRALSAALYLLEERGWLLREIDTSSRVPYPIYCASQTGLKISQAVGRTY